jgi:hypothetical protein
MATRTRNKLTLALSLAVMLALLLAPLAFADTVTNDVAANPGSDTILVGDHTTVSYKINGTGGDDQPGCNASDGSDATVNINIPPNVTATPSSLTFNYCGNPQQGVDFTASMAGDYEISVSVSDTGNGSYNLTPAKFTLHVQEPPPPSDTTPPEISYVLDPASPDGVNGWYKSNVTLTWTVTEDESPDSLVKTGCVDQDITADQPATTYSCSATSDGGSAGPVTASIKRDATVPTLDPSVSPNPVLLNGSATASPKADDATSGVASSGCDPVDTSSVGIHTVQCFATDNAGNTATTSASYTVNYNLCVLYDQTKAHKSGSTVPIKLQLCDVNEVNFSASSAIVTALNLVKIDNSASGIIEDSGNANPDNNFRYDPTLGGTGGYIYNLSTKGLASGTWKLPFKVDNATSPDYWVKFDVK